MKSSPLPLITVAAMFVSCAVGTVMAQQTDEPAISFTAAQAQSGQASYRRYCVDCHGANLNDGEFGGAPLRGTSFHDKWFDAPADALYDFMSIEMPPDRPGALSPGTYADLMAYILSRNGIQPGVEKLPADSDSLGNFVIR